MKFCTACGAEYGDEILFCQRSWRRAYSLNPPLVWKQILDGIN